MTDDEKSRVGERMRDILHKSAIAAVDVNFPHSLMRRCESPIEQLFFVAAWSRGAWTGRLMMLEPGKDGDPAGLLEWNEMTGMTVAGQQVQVGPYRADFLFVRWREGGDPPLLVAVECDGHEFHERTKAQAARDRARDREMLENGVVVFRFTGSEIWADAGKCVAQVLDYLDNEYSKSISRHVDRAEAAAAKLKEAAE
jgi:very-short-patch-repair endonuclease